MSSWRARALLAAGLAAIASAASGGEEAPAQAPPEPDAAELVRRGEAVLRGEGVFVEVALVATSPGRKTPREVRFRAWYDARNERALLRVLAPGKRAGLAFLSLPPNLWRYAPRDATTTRIAPEARRAPWLGSDLSLEEVTSAESDARRYAHRILRVDEAAGEGGALRAFVVESVPRAGADVAWGRVLRWLEAEHGTPLREERYDAKGVLVSSVEWADLREVAGRRFPHLWVFRSHGEEQEGHETRLRFESVRFDPELASSLFTTTTLQPKK